MGRKKDLEKKHKNMGSNNLNHNARSVKVGESTEKNAVRKNQLSKTIMKEFNYITHLFDLLDIENLSQGKVTCCVVS